MSIQVPVDIITGVGKQPKAGRPKWRASNLLECVLPDLPPESATFSSFSIDGVTVISVHGDVDLAQEDELARAVAACGISLMVLDLCDCTFADSTIINIVLRRHQLAPGTLHIACVPEGPVARVFQLTIQNLVGTFESLDAAVNAFATLTGRLT